MAGVGGPRSRRSGRQGPGVAVLDPGRRGNRSGPADAAAAAALVTPEGPTSRVAFRDGALVFDRAMERFAHASRPGGAPSPTVVVRLVLVKPNGSIADSIVENASDRRG